MKYTTASVLAALAGGAVADGWADWSSTTTSSKPVDPITSSSVAWEDWSSSSKPVDPTSSSSSSAYWGDWSASTSSSSKPAVKASTSAPGGGWGAPAPSASTVTVTKTETSTSYGATTTVYKSTVYVGPGPASTVYTCASGAPAGPASGWPSSSAAPVAASSSKPEASWGSPSASVAASSAPAGSWGSPSAPVAASSATGPAGSWGPGAGSSPAASSATGPAGSWGAPSGTDVKGSTVTVSPTAGASGSWGPGGDWGNSGLNPGVSGTVVGTDGGAGWKWTHSPSVDATSSTAAPTYTGWGDWSGEKGGGSNGTGPAAGTDLSNCTKPFHPLPENSCNGANSRSQWCGGFSIDSDYYNVGPDTGVICKYDFIITNTTLNYDGVDRLALAINGQVPGPLVECNWGDTLMVSVTNQMNDNTTSIHWHGITQKESTNDMDGVPGVTECPIAPGTSRVYKFKLTQYGTGWYHSHVLAQLGDGIRGPMVIHGPATANYDIDMGTVMIDDTFGNASVPLSAATANSRIAHFGPGPTFNYLLNGANTLPDLSAGKHALWSVQPGKKHLFRIINSSSQNMWSVHFDNHKMTVIATDYVSITPYTTDWLNIALGQRYMVIIEADQPVSGYFLRAVTQTGCPSACVNTGLGSANGIMLYEGADAVLPTTTAGNKTVADFAFCLDEPIASLSPYLKKSAGTSDAFQASASTLPAGNVAQVATSDDGNVFRWFLNNGALNINYTQPTLKTLAETGNANNSQISNPIILGSKNQWVYFVIANQFFASHPMHLHGHDMSVLGQGTVPWTPALVPTLNFDNPPRRDTALLVGSPGPSAPPGKSISHILSFRLTFFQATPSLASRPITQVLGLCIATLSGTLTVVLLSSGSSVQARSLLSNTPARLRSRMSALPWYPMKQMVATRRPLASLASGDDPHTLRISSTLALSLSSADLRRPRSDTSTATSAVASVMASSPAVTASDR